MLGALDDGSLIVRMQLVIRSPLWFHQFPATFLLFVFRAEEDVGLTVMMVIEPGFVAAQGLDVLRLLDHGSEGGNRQWNKAETCRPETCRTYTHSRPA